VTRSHPLRRPTRGIPRLLRRGPRVAELTGTLDTVLLELATYLETDIEARSAVTSALIYPAVVAVMAIATVIILATFVLPKFRTFFASLNAKLPLPTRMLPEHLGLHQHVVVGHRQHHPAGVIGFVALRRSRRVGPGSTPSS